MSGLRVALADENVAYAGVVSFDGEVFEAALQSAIDAQGGG